jgi:hypothetical protein
MASLPAGDPYLSPLTKTACCVLVSVCPQVGRDEDGKLGPGWFDVTDSELYPMEERLRTQVAVEALQVMDEGGRGGEGSVCVCVGGGGLSQGEERWEETRRSRRGCTLGARGERGDRTACVGASGCLSGGRPLGRGSLTWGLLGCGHEEKFGEGASWADHMTQVAVGALEVRFSLR